MKTLTIEAVTGEEAGIPFEKGNILGWLRVRMTVGLEECVPERVPDHAVDHEAGLVECEELGRISAQEWSEVQIANAMVQRMLALDRYLRGAETEADQIVNPEAYA